MRIAVIDYGLGNRRSVEKALAHVGTDAWVTAAHGELREADGLVLPGVGAFAAGMGALRERGLDTLVRERAAAGVPLLGICLGMQLLFDGSSEHGGAEGLGLVPGRVEGLRAGEGRLPHIGWSLVRWERPSALSAGLPAESAFYHVHSFVARPTDPDDVLGTAEYGERFATAVQRGSLFGVQFHAEKSSTHGLALLAGFARACAPAAVR